MPLSGMTTENYTGSINWGRSTNGLVAQPNMVGKSAPTPVKAAPKPAPVPTPAPGAGPHLVTSKPVPPSLQSTLSYDRFNAPITGATVDGHAASLANDNAALNDEVDMSAITNLRAPGQNLPFNAKGTVVTPTHAQIVSQAKLDKNALRAVQAGGTPLNFGRGFGAGRRPTFKVE